MQVEDTVWKANQIWTSAYATMIELRFFILILRNYLFTSKNKIKFFREILKGTLSNVSNVFLDGSFFLVENI